MHVEERGVGRPVVLVHGWGAGAATWSRQLESLADQFRVLAPDLPGFGSTPPLPRSDAAGFSGALRGLIDGERLSDVLLVGWSMGGLVALDYAARFDCHALAGLVIADVAPRARAAADWPVEADFGRRVEEWTQRWTTERDAVVREVTELAFVDPGAHCAAVEHLVDEAMRADAGAALEAFLNLIECDFRDALGDIRVPMLLLFGGASTSTSPRDAETFAALAPDARLVVFAGCGHALMIEEPQRFDAELRAFARSLATASV